jgi:nucleoside-diphosphate-sugar epimerase
MRKAVDGSERVFHLASAHLSVTLSEKDYWEINSTASRQLVELAHAAGVARFVHCSSVGVYGEIKNPPADEDSTCEPDLVYERTKLEGERKIRQYAQETGYPVVIVRPVWVYGPGCPRTEKLFRTIKKGRFLFLGDGLTLRHCIYISDMIEAFNLCAQQQTAPGRVFIIGDREAVTIRDLIHRMAAVAGASPPRLSVPIGLIRPLCSFIEHFFTSLGKEPPLSERSLKFFTNNTSFDISRAQNELGFVPKVTLQEGLRLTYKATGSSA